MVWALPKMAPPVATVTVAVSPSAMVAGDTVRLKFGVSLREMVMFLVPITVVPCRAVMVMVSASSTTASSRTVMVAVPAVAPAASVMLAGAIA